MTGIPYLFVLTCFATFVFGVQKKGTQDDGPSRCDVIYEALLAIREPLIEIYNPEHAQNTADEFKSLAGVNIGSLIEIHQLACRIADASTITQVATIFGNYRSFVHNVQYERMLLQSMPQAAYHPPGLRQVSEAIVRYIDTLHDLGVFGLSGN